MAMFAPIPMPDNGNQVFKDVMDYFETIRNRKSGELQEANKLKQQQAQFDVTKQLEREKLGELRSYHQAKLAQELEKLKAGKGLSAQERTQRMKLLESGRSAISILNKTTELEKILQENPNLTGWLPHLMSMAGKGGEKLGKFTTTAGDLQAMIGKLASQQGGARIIKWAEKMKPSTFKDVITNLGHVRGLRDTTRADLSDIADEYETITGEKFPLSAPQTSAGNPAGTTVMQKDGKTFHIPNEEVDEARALGYSE